MRQENDRQDDTQPEPQEEASTPEVDPIGKTPIDPFADHPPIIVTGGSSTAIDFERKVYGVVVSGTHQSSDLFLDSVEIVRLDNGSKHICHTLEADEVCLVVIECTRTGLGNKDITVLGGRSVSPSINFDHVEYEEVVSVPDRQRHSNSDRKIERLLIFRVVGGVPVSPAFHKCPLVPENGKCDITINDKHQKHQH
jgi:hypothetical protein